MKPGRPAQLAVLAIVAPVWCGLCPAEPVPVDGYAALVNDRIVTVTEVMATAQPIQRQLQGRYTGEELEERMLAAYREALDSLVERALILEDFESQEGDIPAQVVDDRIDEIIYDRFDNDRAAFLEALAEERVSPEEWRKQVKDQIVIGLLRRQEVADRVSVSPRDVHALYDKRAEEYHVPARTKVSMVVLNKGGTPEDRAVKREEARQVLARLEAGEDFAGLARAVSEGSRASRGGEWGWIDPGILRPELQDALQHIEPGDHSPVLEVGDELYILKVEARQNASVVPFDEVRDDLEEELRQAAAADLYAAWIARLRSKHFVKLY